MSWLYYLKEFSKAVGGVLLVIVLMWLVGVGILGIQWLLEML